MRDSLIIPDSFSSWTLVLYMALFPTAIGFLAWFKAMEKINLSLLNVMQYLIPVFTIVMAWVLLGERMTWLNAIGTGFVIAGIMFVMNIGKIKISGWNKSSTSCKNFKILIKLPKFMTFRFKIKEKASLQKYLH